MANKKKTAIWCTIAAVAVVAVAAVLLLGGKGKTQITLTTARPETISISNSVTATGTVEPVTKVEVGTQVSGIVKNLYVDYNDEVKAGQLIAEMDKETLQAQLDQSNADLANCKTELDYQTKNYNRVKALHDKELVSDTEYDEALYKYENAKNSYNRSYASLKQVKKNLSYATITSPIDGVVISRAVEEGQTVAAGFSTPTLFTIAADLTQMQVIADVDEADIGQVKEGLRVEFSVDAYPDDVFEGKVEQVRLEATTTSNVVTYEVVISAYNPDLKLKPGLTANVTIFTYEKDGVMGVPTKALRFNPEVEKLASIGYSVEPDDTLKGKSVWVVSGNTLKQTPVETGSVSGEMTEIESGLPETAEVATGLVEVDTKAPKEEARSPFMPSGPGDKKK